MKCCDRACLFVTIVVISRKVAYKFDFHDIWHGCSASAPNVAINFSEVKVRAESEAAVLKISRVL